MAKKLGGLGKGLNAIFIENDSETEGGTVTLKISEIEPNRTQPRKEFDEQALSELAESISSTDFYNRCLFVRLHSAVIRLLQAREDTEQAVWQALPKSLL